MSAESITSFHTITKQVRTVTRSDTGSQTKSWTDVEDLKCTVQPVNPIEAQTFLKSTERAGYAVYFHSDPDVRPDRNRFLFTDSEGRVKTLEIISPTRNIVELDRIYRVDCEWKDD